MKDPAILGGCLVLLAAAAQPGCGVKQDPIPYVVAYPDEPPAPAAQPAAVPAASGKQKETPKK